MVKYLICPGIVKSQYDGEHHYITAGQLMSLYKVNPKECKIIDSPDAARGVDWGAYIVLRPRTDGNYIIEQ